MSSDSRFRVKCIAEVPEHASFVVGKEYDASEGNHGQGPTVWVGVHGQWVVDFSPKESAKYFERIPAKVA